MSRIPSPSPSPSQSVSFTPAARAARSSSSPAPQSFPAHKDTVSFSGNHQKVEQVEHVELKNGSKVNKAIVLTVLAHLEALDEMGGMGNMALFDLLARAKKSNSPMLPFTPKMLIDATLMEADGSITEDNKDIILSALKRNPSGISVSLSDPRVAV